MSITVTGFWRVHRLIVHVWQRSWQFWPRIFFERGGTNPDVALTYCSLIVRLQLGRWVAEFWQDAWSFWPTIRMWRLRIT